MLWICYEDLALSSSASDNLALSYSVILALFSYVIDEQVLSSSVIDDLALSSSVIEDLVLSSSVIDELVLSSSVT